MCKLNPLGTHLWTVLFLLAPTSVALGDEEDWIQFKYNALRSGNAPNRLIEAPLGLVGAIPTKDAILTSPVVSEGRAYVVDASGVVFCIDAKTLEVEWTFKSRGGEPNCNNVSSPAVAGRFLHFATTAGFYHVLDKRTGALVKEIACGEPIFNAPVVANGRVYFVTLSSRVHALEHDGTVCWAWDFLGEEMGFARNRWSGMGWLGHLRGRVRESELFLCTAELAMAGDTLVVPAGGTLVWLRDTGDKPAVTGVHRSGRWVTLGLSLGDDGTVYRQCERNDNISKIDRLRLRNGTVEQLGAVAGSQTGPSGSTDLLSFTTVSLRAQEVFRTRVQEGFGLSRHVPDLQQPQVLNAAASIASSVLLKDVAIYGDLKGRLHVVPLSGTGKTWSFRTAFGKSISAPVAVSEGRIWFGCEDGYLYVLGRGGKAPLPPEDLQVWKIRSPLSSKLADSEHDRFSSFGNFTNTNASRQGLEPPFKIKWIRRFKGTTKHFSTCGGGRMYTHTAEGQIFAVEQETGRLLWRNYFPGVHISYTAPLYYNERLIVPQAGLNGCTLRCLDAATGRLIWEATFTGSPGWTRQSPPVVFGNLAIYMFGTGKYGPGTPVNWLFPHYRTRSYPSDHKPIVRAYDLDSGKTVWELDFSEHGSGGDDSGLCLMNGTLYYSCYFGSAPQRRGLPAPRGITAAIDPGAGRVLWLTTEYSVQGGCTVSGDDGRLYLGGAGAVGSPAKRYVWCLDARDGSLIWRSEPVSSATHVVAVGPRFLLLDSDKKVRYLLDKENGKIITTFAQGYKCTRFTLSEPYVLASNLDIFDVSDVKDIRLVSSGPRLDPSECTAPVMSNGRLFYTGHASGIQVSRVFGTEARAFVAPWDVSRKSGVRARR